MSDGRRFDGGAPAFSWRVALAHLQAHTPTLVERGGRAVSRAICVERGSKPPLGRLAAVARSALGRRFRVLLSQSIGQGSSRAGMGEGVAGGAVVARSRLDGAARYRNRDVGRRGGRDAVPGSEGSRRIRQTRLRVRRG